MTLGGTPLGGNLPGSLTLQTSSTNTTSDKTNPKVYAVKKKKKGKVILWVFLILALVSISFWLYKRKR